MSILDTGARSRSSINFDITTRALRDMINSRLFGKGTFTGNHSDVQIVANDQIDPQTLRAKYHNAAIPVQDLYKLAFKNISHVLSAKEFPFPALGLRHLYNNTAITGSQTPEPAFPLGIKTKVQDIQEVPGRFDITLHTSFSQRGAVIAHMETGYCVKTGKSEKRDPLTTDGFIQLEPVPTYVTDGSRYRRDYGDGNPIHRRVLSRILYRRPPIAHGAMLIDIMIKKAKEFATFEEQEPRALNIDFIRPVTLGSYVSIWENKRSRQLLLTDTETGKAHTLVTYDF